jgi:hypothetical protein
VTSAALSNFMEHLRDRHWATLVGALGSAAVIAPAEGRAR